MGGRKGRGTAFGFMGAGKARDVIGDNRKASDFEVRSYLNSERYAALKHALQVTGIRSPVVREELAALNTLPIGMVQEFGPTMARIRLSPGTRLSTTFKDIKLGNLSKWDKSNKPGGDVISGMYHTEGGKGYIDLAANIYNRNDRMFSLAGSRLVHEFGHHVSLSTGYGSTPQWASIHKKLYNRLNPYYRQGGPGGFMGREELFAQAFNVYATRGRDSIRSTMGDDAARYLDEVFGTYKPKSVRR